MAYHGDILMTPNPVYAEVSAIQKEKEVASASEEAVNLWQACKKYNTKKVITYILLSSFLFVQLCLIVALLVVTVAPSQPVPSSCADIIESSPLSVSGYYVVRSSSGSLVQVYCDMGVVCDGNSRGWMRLVDVNYLHYWSSSLRNSSTCNTRGVFYLLIECNMVVSVDNVDRLHTIVYTSELFSPMWITSI